MRFLGCVIPSWPSVSPPAPPSHAPLDLRVPVLIRLVPAKTLCVATALFTHWLPVAMSS